MMILIVLSAATDRRLSYRDIKLQGVEPKELKGWGQCSNKSINESTKVNIGLPHDNPHQYNPTSSRP